MRKIEITELRERQMQILDYVAEFCDQNGIRYWLDSGTLLGAIRHKGFIPWDDDVDIGMLREDYERFQKLFIEECDRPEYVFRGPETDNDWHLPFGKVMDMTTLLLQDGRKLGINIDVFPFDDAPDDESKAARMYQTRDRLKVLNAASLSKAAPEGSIFRKTVVRCGRVILHMFPRYWFIRAISKQARKYNGKNLNKVGNFTGEAKMKPSEKRLVAKTVDAVFENRTYKVPEFYDEWLSAFYGSDYMQLPPVEKRKRHKFEAYVND